MCCGVPFRLGTDALHEFFDRQDSGDPAARNVSIIALTDRPEYISEQIMGRFFQQILLENLMLVTIQFLEMFFCDFE